MFKNTPRISEPIPVKDTFATGWDLYFNPEFVRFMYFAEHPLMYGPDPLEPLERQMVAKIVMPQVCFLRAVEYLDAMIPARRVRS